MCFNYYWDVCAAIEKADAYSVKQMKYADIDKDSSWKEQPTVVEGSLSIQKMAKVFIPLVCFSISFSVSFKCSDSMHKSWLHLFID